MERANGGRRYPGTCLGARPIKWKSRKNSEEKNFARTLNSMEAYELVAFDLELKSESYGINTIEEMKALVRKKIYARIIQNEQDEILQILAQSLKARLDSVLNNEKTASHFFVIFQDAASGDPPMAYRNTLKEFFFAHTAEIMALDFRPEEIKALNQAISSFDVSIKILQEMLERSENADEFFAIFKAVTTSYPSDEDKSALKKFLNDNRRKLKKLSLPTEYFEYVDSYMNKTPTEVTPLEEGLKWTGNADEFYATFNTLAVRNPTDNHRQMLNKFFDDNTKTVKKLPFSAKQIKRMEKYIDDMEISIMFLKGGLEQAGGDADKFFDIFKAITSFSPTKEYKEELEKFFEDNAEYIKKLPFSTKQIKYMDRYIDSIKTSIILLEGGLAQAGGDGDKFFAVFKTIAVLLPTKEYKKALEKFFLKKAETILSLELSAKQIRYMDRYIDAPSVSARILDASLKKSRENCAVNAETLFP